ncbi:hypothetical protein ES703_126036 [subsurface metagenome]
MSVASVYIPEGIVAAVKNSVISVYCAKSTRVDMGRVLTTVPLALVKVR